MKIVFFGTPNYVLPVLESLHKTFKSKAGESPIAAVVTQTPKPVGRKQQLEYSPVDTWAHKKNVPIYFDGNDLIRNKVQADLGLIASYGKIISKEVIEHFPKGIINVHFSLLPEFRGASPTEAAIITGQKEIGVTIFKIDELLDHGPIISQFTEVIQKDDTVETLRIKLFKRVAEVLMTLIPAYLQDKITLRDQDHSKATYTKIVKKEDAFIPPEFLNVALQGQAFKGKWNIPFIKDFEIEPTPRVIERYIRAMQPWPIAWTNIKILRDKEIKRLRILKSHLESSATKATKPVPRAYTLVPDLVQLEGKLPVTWKQFLEGYTDIKFIQNPDIQT
ncbi:MAG: Methionyl-tRNA formyltransferase [Candidatus Woesebacteria bacterium GW2011_GWB1_39_10b]|uniref:methionyl-tRNA formyltransferase n=2 Tax=Candidatus Woeseibacteriota TaxID=1752722 RepID=A0A0G0NDU1_9BACT|nr:MAG: methionyl-tRNA formyltransferase, methionyl-tRNA formyltransferase [Microgenomates group bacterium GW2011_GWC1_38_12]KKQ93476.1 MAG: Methionyl-tRNA formyltransferase [Candidatus Woesebacteria bacterium GW2011_GWB1_39_10b]KKR13638.1 MAG: Methionyl-tRNA formyltransferase [Candidatus Woesebacteria bacterium GW2011_GWA1_39_21b]